MAAGLRHRLEHVGAQLVGELNELATLERTQLRRIVDPFQELEKRGVVGGRVASGG